MKSLCNFYFSELDNRADFLDEKSAKRLILNTKIIYSFPSGSSIPKFNFQDFLLDQLRSISFPEKLNLNFQLFIDQHKNSVPSPFFNFYVSSISAHFDKLYIHNFLLLTSEILKLHVLS
jgi:hypothetical protein